MLTSLTWKQFGFTDYMFVFSLSAPAGRGLFGMRAFFLPSRGDVNAPARSVEQPAASHVPSTLEQPADSFTSITTLTVWLKAQGDASSSPELRRLRAAVAVLANKPNRNKDEVRGLCSARGCPAAGTAKGTAHCDVDRRVAASGSREGRQAPRQRSRRSAGSSRKQRSTACEAGLRFSSREQR